MATSFSDTVLADSPFAQKYLDDLLRGYARQKPPIVTAGDLEKRLTEMGHPVDAETIANFFSGPVDRTFFTSRSRNRDFARAGDLTVTRAYKKYTPLVPVGGPRKIGRRKLTR